MFVEIYNPPELPCIDTGLYLTHASFDADEAEVVDAARTAGVLAMIALGIDLASSEATAQVCGHYARQVYAAVGVHPNAAASFDATTTSRLRTLASHSNVVALGLCGLDLERRLARQSVQERCLTAQLELAAETSLPLILTVHGAHARAHELLAPRRLELDHVVLHDFAGTRPELERWLELGCHIAFSGRLCDPRRGVELRELARLVPPGQLAVCSDAPFAPPLDITPRIRRNEPRWLPHVVHALAQCRGEEPIALARLLVANSRECFRLRTEVTPALAEGPLGRRQLLIDGHGED